MWRSVLVDVEKERQEWREGAWQQETPCKEELELVKHSRDLRFEGSFLLRACYAGRSVTGRAIWKNSERMAGSVFGQVSKLRECYNEVEAEDEGPLSITQDFLCRSTDLLGMLVEKGVLPSRTCVLIVIASRWKTTFGGSLLGAGRNPAAGGVCAL